MEFLFKLKSSITGKGNAQAGEVTQEKRFSPRIQCEVEASCAVLGPQGQAAGEHPVVVTEIGLFGLRMNIAAELKRGDTVLITAMKGFGILAGARYSVGTVKLKVMWSKRRPVGKDYMTGLQFTDTKKSLRDSWVAFLLKRYGVTVGQSAQRRRNIRLPIQLPASFLDPDSAENLTGSLQDIGVGGMLVTMERQMKVGSVLRFRIGPYKFFPPFFIKGRILHSRFAPAQGKWVAGVIFDELQDKELKPLNTYLTHLYFDKAEAARKAPPRQA